MSYLDNIVFSAECQGFIIGNPNYNSEKCSFTFSSHSHRPTADMNCPHCGSKHIHQNKIYARTVKGIPLHPGCSTLIKTSVRSFECQECKKVFSENVPFLYPGTRITKDLAAWIEEMLTFCSISAISRLFGVNWETVKGIHKGLATRIYLKDLHRNVYLLFLQFLRQRASCYRKVNLLRIQKIQPYHQDALPEPLLSKQISRPCGGAVYQHCLIIAALDYFIDDAEFRFSSKEFSVSHDKNRIKDTI